MKITITLRTDPLEQFIALYCFPVNGALIPFGEFRQRFQAWLPREERYHWTPYTLSRALRASGHVVGAHTANWKFVGNLSWEPGFPDGEFIMVEHKKRRRLARV